MRSTEAVVLGGGEALGEAHGSFAGSGGEEAAWLSFVGITLVFCVEGHGVLAVLENCFCTCLKLGCGAAHLVCLVCSVASLRAKDASEAAFNALHYVHE